MDSLCNLFKALSDGNRLRVVAALLEYEELCACQLVELLGVSGATASRHMGILISAGLVASRKEGRWVYYRLLREREEIRPLLDWMQKQTEQLRMDRVALQNITSCEPEELCRKQRGDVCCPIS